MRFTSLAAWIPIGLILVLRSTGNSKIRILLGLCTPFGLLGVLFGCCIDRWFYGFWAIPFLGNIHFNVLLGESRRRVFFSPFVVHSDVHHIIMTSSRRRSWIALWNTPLFVVCIRWYSCHLRSHAAFFHLGDFNNPIWSSITITMDHCSIYYLALVFGTQGISLPSPCVAYHLHFGWTCLESIDRCDGEHNTDQSTPEEAVHAIQLYIGCSHPIKLSASPLLGFNSPTRSNCNQSIFGLVH